jgi:hypothetical protein
MSSLFINLVPITVGGGLQNAINFLLNIDFSTFKTKSILIVIRDNSTLIDICNKKNFKYKVIKKGFLSRLYYELFFYSNKTNSVIFTLFGTKPILSWNTFTITGCAYSNLFYPEIDFWGYLPIKQRIVKKLKDIYRFNNVKSSNVVIFETDLLRKKAVSEFGFESNNTYVVKMAVSSLIKETEPINRNDKVFKILYLGSAHPNKRQHLIPKIIGQLLNNSYTNFQFIVTMNKNLEYTKNVLDDIDKNNLEKYFLNLEYVNNTEVDQLISSCDAMINIAKLESFSNNFVEAWQMKKLLLVTDADWSRDSCGNAAFYLDVENLEILSNQLIGIITNNSLRNEIILNGENHIQSYPSPIEKMTLFVDIINKYTKD